jgi:hypothetical protein
MILLASMVEAQRLATAKNPDLHIVTKDGVRLSTPSSRSSKWTPKLNGT